MEAQMTLMTQPTRYIAGPIELKIIVGRTTKRKADCANFEKATSDLLVKAGIIEDDSLIQRNIQEWHTGSEGIKIIITPLDYLL